MSTVKIRDLLHGCEPARMQSVGFMQVVPLTSDLQDERFASPTDASVSTSTYGTVKFRNTQNKRMIVPVGATYIVDQAAQNHALPHAAVLKANAIKAYETAMCVQQSQGGMIKEGKHQLMILPFSLRERAHKIRREHNFNRLWPAISEFNHKAKVPQARTHGGHLEHFFNHYKDQLDTFVAQFEPVAKQIGAVVLIGGKVVGIERCPSYDFFSSVWRPLIRECYGSLALLEASNHEGPPPVPKTRVPIAKATTLTQLRANLQQAMDEEFGKVGDLVEKVANVDLRTLTDEQDDQSELVVDALGDEPFVGQCVRDSGRVVYASLVATEHWRKHEDWFMAPAFSMKRK